MRTVVCEENKCSFIVKAPKKWVLEKIKIDGGLINNNLTERCDYAVKAYSGNNLDTYIFIELKGTDLRKAISQLETTINTLKDHYSGYKHRYARAVCSRIIPFVTSESQVSVKRFRDRYGFCLKWSARQGNLTVTG